MPPSTKSVTLTTGRHLSDTRCYLKDSQGEVHEATLHLSEDFLESATRKGFKEPTVEWSSAGFALDCDEESSLCSVTWESNNRSIFYQDKQKTLREWRLVDGKGWQKTGFEQQNVTIGTSVAVVSGTGDKQPIILFFQDQDGFVCFRTMGEDSKDAPSTRLVKGALLTGIGACLDSDSKTIRVYYQDENLAIRECYRNQKAKWTLTKDLVSKRDINIHDIVTISSVINGKPEIRLYMQDAKGTVIECKRSPPGWETRSLTTKAMTSANIIAISSPSPNFRIGVLWISNDHNLYICDYDDQAAWHEPRALVLLQHKQDKREALTSSTAPFDKPAHSATISEPHKPVSAPEKPGSRANQASSTTPTLEKPSYPATQHPPAGTTPNTPSHSTPNGGPVSINGQPATSGSVTNQPASTAGSGQLAGPTTDTNMPSPAAANGYTTASHTGTNGTAPPTTALQPRKLEPKTDSTASVPDFKTSEDYPQKVIMEVGMHVTWRVDGIKIVHKNDAETAKRGTSTKGEKVFLLDEGEYITHVWYAADAGSVQGILFGTSNGRKSVWFGYEYGLYGLLIKDSHVLTDLRGASQDSQLNDLVPSWVRYIPGGGITAFLALYDELVARWNEFQSSIAELKKQTVSSKASLDELTTYEQTIARGLAELVQDVEILRGMENEQSTAQVVVTSLREKYISNHLGACKEAARAAQTQFNNLALALAPISGQLDTLVDNKRREGEDLLRLFVKLRGDVQSYVQKLVPHIARLEGEEKLWAEQAQQSRIRFSQDKVAFNNCMTSKDFHVEETDDQAAALWGLQKWYNTLQLGDLQGAFENHILSQVRKSDAQMQYHLSHVAFLQRSRRLLSARKDQAEALQLDQTIAALRSTIDGLNSLRSSHDAVANGAKELAALIATSVDLLKGLQDADKSQAFAKILVRVLQTILDNHSFDWGNMDGQKLLKVSTEHSTGPSV